MGGRNEALGDSERFDLLGRIAQFGSVGGFHVDRHVELARRDLLELFQHHVDALNCGYTSLVTPKCELEEAPTLHVVKRVKQRRDEGGSELEELGQVLLERIVVKLVILRALLEVLLQFEEILSEKLATQR